MAKRVGNIGYFISVLFTFRCLMLVAGDFSAILRTIDQTFFIEVRLLILETHVCQECRFGFNHTPGFGPDDSVIFNILFELGAFAPV